MDNYPIGAARDPRAPYNEPEEREISVTARAVLVKDASVAIRVKTKNNS
jgi:hypothetical protein